MPVVIDSLDPEAIRRRLRTRTVDWDLRLYDEVTSTNDVLRELARAGAPEGTVVLAETQTAAHGRLGKRWFSPPGVNLYVSVLFRPAIPPSAVGAFSFITSLAVVDAIKGLGIEAAIKWPNDVLVDRKKVAGTLVECATAGDRVEHVILGVGVNLNVTRDALAAGLGEESRAAGALRSAAGREIDRNAFAAAFLGALEAWFRTYRDHGARPILAAWLDRDIVGGRRVEVRGEARPWEGRALGVDQQGYLVVRDPRGIRHRVVTGEIRLLD